MNTTNIAKISEVDEVFSARDKKSLSLIGTNCHSFYHISDCLLPVILEILDRTGDNSLNDQKGGRGDA